MTRENAPLSPPPEGAVAGENVPIESEPDRVDETIINQTVGILKSRSGSFRELSETRQRRKAIEMLRKDGVGV